MPDAHVPPQPVFRKDYTPPSYWIDRTDLEFELGDSETCVKARIAFRKNDALDEASPPLVLHGENIELKAVRVDGKELADSEYECTAENLIIPNVPERFVLETEVVSRPQDNTELSGLYRSSGNFCTQCEAEGFRRITYYLDRPDVMSFFSTKIVADANKYPVLLSNGNRKDGGTLEDGRHWVVWEDPFVKPCYLFALVAGNLSCHAGEFVTCSGRTVRLEIWVEPQNIDSCEHAVRSLQKSMKWDEETYGLEYDLDIYMIVAVNDFNMGAMENKGLNIFNSKYVLASPESATDNDYEGVERVIAHEYFHNWTGNRVTCRDWFQLTLKEGLTVYRDQLFSEDMTSKAVKRIGDVRVLRVSQFAEDAGPMAHPIRPDSYIVMDNFYTSTVYNKGAEIIRMYETLLGNDGFRKGMDLYFERHDGQAVSCDDFRAAMADANQKDLTQFENWYLQAGTPEVEASGEFNKEQKTFTLQLKQSYPEVGAGARQERLPVHMPVQVGLLGEDGKDLPLALQGESNAEASTCTTRLLELKEAEESFVFTGIEAPPVMSLFRSFSAPMKLRIKRSNSELAFLMANDSDSFNRWDAGQELAQRLILDLSTAYERDETLQMDPLFVDAWGRLLKDETLDGSMKALALSLPAEAKLAQEVDIDNPTALHEAREHVVKALAEAHRETLQAMYESHQTTEAYTIDKVAIDRRRAKNTALAYLAKLNAPEVAALLWKQFEAADNMTDVQAALIGLTNMDCPERQKALDAFYAKWKDAPLVLDKWFAVQASANRKDALECVLELTRHPDFSIKNPNRLRALVGSFCMGNRVNFHREDGAGYSFLGDLVLEVGPLNPQVASRLVSAFNSWRRFGETRQGLMRDQLERIAASEGLSKDVGEIVRSALK